MFVSEKPLKFVRSTEIDGVSQKTNKPYSIRNITLSDGIESFTLDYNQRLMLPVLNRGDLVKVRASVEEINGTTRTIVQSVEPNK